MNRVNLIPTRYRHQRILRARQNGWLRILVIYSMLLTAGYGGWRMIWGNDGQDLTRQLAIAHGDLEVLNRSITRLRAVFSETQGMLRANQAVMGQPDWSLLLALVARLRGEEVILNRCALDAVQASPQTASAGGVEVPSTPLLQLQGYGKTQTAVSQFSLRLEQTGLFEAVTLLKTNRESLLSGEAIAFRMECRLKIGISSPPAKTKSSVAAQPLRRGAVAGISDAGDNTP